MIVVVIVVDIIDGVFLHYFDNSMNNYELFDQDYCYYHDDNLVVNKSDYNLDESNCFIRENCCFIRENSHDKCQ
jgi:hypothetical protein